MRKSRTKFRKSSSRKHRSRRMPKTSKRVSRRRVSRRRVSRHRRSVLNRRRTSKYKMDDLLQEAAAGAGCIAGRVGCDDSAPMAREMHRLSLRDWPRVVAPGVPPPQIKDCGDYNWHAPQPGISKWESGCPPWQLTGHVRPYTRAERISRMMISNPGRVVAARRDALNDERLSAERAYSQAISEGLLLPSEIAVLERRFRALEKELYGPPPQPGEVVFQEEAVGTGSPWENPESRARLCKTDHHRNCKCGKRDRIFWPDSSGDF